MSSAYLARLLQTMRRPEFGVGNPDAQRRLEISPGQRPAAPPPLIF
jgi:hypothetical protein